MCMFSFVSLQKILMTLLWQYLEAVCACAAVPDKGKGGTQSENNEAHKRVKLMQ